MGFLCFFLLAVAPTLKSLDPATRAKVFPEIATETALVGFCLDALVESFGRWEFRSLHEELAKTDADECARTPA